MSNTRSVLARAWLFVAVCLLSAACSRPSLDIQPLAGDHSMAITNGSVEYPDALQAALHFDIEQSRRCATSDAQRAFADGLESLMRGELDAAERALREAVSTDDAEVQENSKNLLAYLLLSQFRWADLLELAPKETSTGTLVFSRAFSGVPAQRYRFPSQQIVLPMSFYRRGLPMIEVEIAEQKWRFLLDTGASISMVATEVAEACGVRPLGTAIGYLNDEVPIRPAMIERLEIGGLSIENHPVALISSYDLNLGLLGWLRSARLDGVIGWPVIRNLVLEIDYRKARAIITEPEPGLPGPRNLFHLQHPLVEVHSQNGIRLYFALDTGAAESEVRRKAYEKLGLCDLDSRWRLVGRIGGHRLGREEAIPQLTLLLGSYGLHFQNLTLGPISSGISDGRLGNDVFRHGSIAIDYQNGRFEFELDEAEGEAALRSRSPLAAPVAAVGSRARPARRGRGRPLHPVLRAPW